MEIDTVQLRFDESGLLVLNIVLALVMFGVALDLRWADFKRIGARPKGPAVGLLTQFLLLPLGSFLLVLLLRPAPSLALGMMLVAACPGGNLSNFLAHLARGRTVLSITMTAAATVLALFMTPFNTAFWAARYEPTAKILQDVSLDPWGMLLLVAGILGFPLIAGMLLAAHKPALAEKLKKPLSVFSLVAFAAFLALAFAANFKIFMEQIGTIFWLVAAQNALGLSLGYFTAKLSGLSEAEARAISIEVGIQNSGLGLALTFQFFNGLGGMALIAAWYGVWHLVAGLILASFWSRRPPSDEEPEESQTDPGAHPDDAEPLLNI